MSEDYKLKPLTPLTDEKIQECREWLARRRARLDQRKAQFEGQYNVVSPKVNAARLEDLEAIEFWIEIHEWELGESTKGQEDDEAPTRS